MEVNSGKVKAIANLGRSSDGQYYEQLIYAVGRLYELGSTLKLATMLALFEDQQLELDQKIKIAPGYLRVGSGKLRDTEGYHRDTATVEEVFEFASNVGTAYLVSE